MPEVGPLDDDYGTPVDDELADGIPLIGFADDLADEAPADEELAHGITFIGFTDDEDADDGGAAGAVAARPTRLQQLAAALRARLRGARAYGAQLPAQIRQTATEFRLYRTTALVVVAVLLSVVAGVVVRNLVTLPSLPRHAAVPPPAPPARPSSVLVARTVLPPGHVLASRDLRWQEWPRKQIKPGYIESGKRRVGEFRGFVTRATVAAGEPITPANVIAPAGHGMLSAMLRPGMRAVAIRISPATAVGGLIMPGDRVNVLVSMPVPEPDSGHGKNKAWAVTRILKDIPVLAIDQQLDVAAGRAIVGHTATLEVTPKQAEIVTLADFLGIEHGTFQLTLSSLSPAASARDRK